MSREVVPSKRAPHLTEEDREAVERAVADAESRTSGEIRVHVSRDLLPFQNPRRRAIRQFFRLGMDRTRDATGVLLFFVLEKRRFEIVADRGIHTRVAEGTWDRMAREIEKAIGEKGLSPGICHGVRLVGDVLAQHAPRLADDRDELSNEVSLSDAEGAAPGASRTEPLKNTDTSRTP
jgi:uncharacterized membrane protein